MNISFPYEYYIFAVNHKNKKSKKEEVYFVGRDSLSDYPSSWCSYKEAIHFNSLKDALTFFGEYKNYIVTNNNIFETSNPRIIKVTCVEDPIVQFNMERSL